MPPKGRTGKGGLLSCRPYIKCPPLKNSSLTITTEKPKSNIFFQNNIKNMIIIEKKGYNTIDKKIFTAIMIIKLNLKEGKMPYKVLNAVQGKPYEKDGKLIPKVTLTLVHEGKEVTAGLFSPDSPSSFIGKEIDITLEERTASNGNTYFVAKKPRDGGGNKFQKTDITIKLDILNAIREIDKWTAIMNEADPIKVAEKLFAWVKK